VVVCIIFLYIKVFACFIKQACLLAIVSKFRGGGSRQLRSTKRSDYSPIWSPCSHRIVQVFRSRCILKFSVRLDSNYFAHLFRLCTQLSILRLSCTQQGCQILPDTISQNWEKYTKLPQHYQMFTKYSKWPKNIPNDHNIYLRSSKNGIFGFKIYHLATLALSPIGAISFPPH
jgi:hypothetical protein